VRPCLRACQPAVSPEAKAAAQDAKNKGNAAFSAGQFADAAAHFTAAIAADASDHIFFSNRRCGAGAGWRARDARARRRRGKVGARQRPTLRARHMHLAQSWRRPPLLACPHLRGCGRCG
jgi:hypothetical protein